MFLRVLLFLSVAFPAVAVSWGYADGQRVFVLYREPKWASAMALTAFFVAMMVALRPQVWSFEAQRKVWRRPAMVLGGLWLLWATVGLASGPERTVPELYFYEICQWWIFGAFLVTLLAAGGGKETSWASTVESALITSIFGVTVVGCLQLWGWWPTLNELLPSINPQFGSNHSSLMGYKNPAALAVLGQIFLVAARIFRPGPVWQRGLYALMVGLELYYLSSLHSRTSYVAVLAAMALGVVLFGITTVRSGRAKDLGWKVPATVVGVAVLFVGAIFFQDETAERFRSIGSYLSVETYLASDRGAYLQNTLNMVEVHPAGVGLGQWQAFYPVFRKYQRDRSFDETFQVRRAHSDHVQMLGETGAPGALLWIGFWLALLWGTVRVYGRTSSLNVLFLSLQGAALFLAMCADYMVEMPFHKLQVLCVVFLMLNSGLGSGRQENSEELENPEKPQRSYAVKVGVSMIMLCWVFVSSVQGLKKHQVSAEIQRRHGELVERLARDGRVEARAIEDLLHLGRIYEGIPGWSKIQHRDHLALAHGALLLDRRDEARRHIHRALELHPYSSKAMRLMAQTVPPAQAEVWKQAYRHIMDEAEQGFKGPYPSDS